MISQKTRSTLSYIFGSLVIIVGAILIIGLASGYSFDIFSGKFSATGLVLLNSNPTGAQIEINGRNIKQTTPYRLTNVESGLIQVRFKKTGYRDWSSSYFVRAKEVTFADYALLIPDQIEQRMIEKQITFNNILSHKKGRTILSSNQPVAIWDLSNSDQLNQLAIIQPFNNQMPAAINLMQFSEDGNELLFQATYADGSTSLQIINLSSRQIINLTTDFPLPLGEIMFNPNNSKEIFSLNGSVLQKINIDNKNISTLPLFNIQAFILDKDFLYTVESLTPAEKGSFVIRYDHAGNNRYVLNQLPASTQSYQLQASNLHNIQYLGILNKQLSQLSVVRIDGNKIDSSVLSEQVSSFSFSPKGRFLSYVQDNKLKTFDFEFNEHHKSSKNVAISTGITWLTDFQIMYQSPEKNIYIIDYNGQNNYLLPPEKLVPTDNVIFTNNNENKLISVIINGLVLRYNLQPKFNLINFR